MIDVPHAAPVSFALYHFLSLALRADEQDFPSVRCQLHHSPVSFVDHPQRLLKVDYVNTVALGENIPLHLGIPAPRLMPEVDTGLQKGLHRQRFSWWCGAKLHWQLWGLYHNTCLYNLNSRLGLTSGPFLNTGHPGLSQRSPNQSDFMPDPSRKPHRSLGRKLSWSYGALGADRTDSISVEYITGANAGQRRWAVPQHEGPVSRKRPIAGRSATEPRTIRPGGRRPLCPGL